MNRPLSMTAFGRGEACENDRSWTVEVRSVNHRYCDISVRIPRNYLLFEEKIKKEIMQVYSRGKIDVSVSVNGGQATSKLLQANLSLAKEYHRCLLLIKEELSLADDVNLSLLAGFKDVVIPVDEEEDLEMLWQTVRSALQQALSDSMEMRQQEGRNLKNDLQARIIDFQGAIEQIEAKVPDLVEKRQQTVTERLQKLLEGVDLDPTRLAQEVAFLADKSDITEEIVRLFSHIDQFKHFLELDEPVGRRLDFLMQEFFREINTMTSKIGDVSVTHKVVELKNEIEKMREQVQNLE